MSEFRTEITLAKAEKQIDISHNILTIGSCFAENIGNKFAYHKFNALTNPFGILYNPQSIYNNLTQITNQQQFTHTDLIQNADVWYSWHHHGKYANTNKQLLLDEINQLSQTSFSFLKKCNYCVITFGTAWVYKLADSNTVVANCHKLPARNFVRYKLSADEISAKYKQLIKQIHTINPNVQFIFTVSPVRHLKDGAIQNQQSKATLLLAIADIVEAEQQTHYFPSYELMIDDLRDYRFYANDMLHPSDLAIDYIWQKFNHSWINNRTQQFMQLTDKLKKAINHRPFMPQTAEYKKFINKQLEVLQKFKNEHPYLDFSEEENLLNNKIQSIKQDLTDF